MGLVYLPLRYTENHPRKSIRVIGVLVFALLFFPVGMVSIVLSAILAIPSMIQDA